MRGMGKCKLMIDEEEEPSSAIVLHPYTAVLLSQLSRTMETLLPSSLHDLQGRQGRGLQDRRGEESFHLPCSRQGVDAAKVL
jgi:hypothetical protein